MTFFSRGWALLALPLLAACSQLPLDGPTPRDITASATATLANSRDTVVYDYAIVDINPAVIEALDEVSPDSFSKTFGLHNGPPPASRVGAGDVLQVAIFESSAGGLFVPSEAGTRLANFVTLPNQTVSGSGNISVPYAGSVQAAGKTISEIQHDIEGKLSKRAIEPQVVVTLVENNAEAVGVIGDTIAGANKFRITGAGERILDMISKAGGLRYPGYEAFVTLQRRNRKATVPFTKLIDDPRENIFVAPGDTVYVYREQKKYLALGAVGAGVSAGQTSGLLGQFAFEQERLSLNEAIAKAGGLQDTRANPAQVFLYRTEHRKTLEKMAVDLTHFAPDQDIIPTVYRANFRDPSSFFFAQRFAMRNKDVIYAANADSIEVEKFLSYVRSVTSTVSGVGVDGKTVDDIAIGRHVLQ